MIKLDGPWWDFPSSEKTLDGYERSSIEEDFRVRRTLGLEGRSCGKSSWLPAFFDRAKSIPPRQIQARAALGDTGRGGAYVAPVPQRRTCAAAWISLHGMDLGVRSPGGISGLGIFGL